MNREEFLKKNPEFKLEIPRARVTPDQANKRLDKIRKDLQIAGQKLKEAGTVTSKAIKNFGAAMARIKSGLPIEAYIIMDKSKIEISQDTVIEIKVAGHSWGDFVPLKQHENLQARFDALRYEADRLFELMTSGELDVNNLSNDFRYLHELMHQEFENNET